MAFDTMKHFLIASSTSDCVVEETWADATEASTSTIDSEGILLRNATMAFGMAGALATPCTVKQPCLNTTKAKLPFARTACTLARTHTSDPIKCGPTAPTDVHLLLVMDALMHTPGSPKTSADAASASLALAASSAAFFCLANILSSFFGGALRSFRLLLLLLLIYNGQS